MTGIPGESKNMMLGHRVHRRSEIRHDAGSENQPGRFVADLNAKWALCPSTELWTARPTITASRSMRSVRKPYSAEVDDQKFNLFSITVVDRANINWTDGR
jgi:hypothetical protein